MYSILLFVMFCIIYSNQKIKKESKLKREINIQEDNAKYKIFFNNLLDVGYFMYKNNEHDKSIVQRWIHVFGKKSESAVIYVIFIVIPSLFYIQLKNKLKVK